MFLQEIACKGIYCLPFEAFSCNIYHMDGVMTNRQEPSFPDR